MKSVTMATKSEMSDYTVIFSVLGHKKFIHKILAKSESVRFQPLFNFFWCSQRIALKFQEKKTWFKLASRDGLDVKQMFVFLFFNFNFLSDPISYNVMYYTATYLNKISLKPNSKGTLSCKVLKYLSGEFFISFDFYTKYNHNRVQHFDSLRLCENLKKKTTCF